MAVKGASAIPAAWGNEPIDTLTGIDLVDKHELINKPFLITQIQFVENARNVEYVYVDCLDETGNAFRFVDSSSTGIRQQLVEHVTTLGKAGIVDSGEVFPVRLAMWRGLRVSAYKAPDGKGKMVDAKTYYLALTPAE